MIVPLDLSRCSYGAILEKFQKHDSSVMGRIKGCIVDSAPVAAPDPQVNGGLDVTVLFFVNEMLLLHHFDPSSLSFHSKICSSPLHAPQ